MSPLSHDATLEDALVESARSLEFFCKFFLPETFFASFDNPIHQDVFRVLDDPKIDRLVMCLPRGAGKTSLLNKAYTMREMLLGDLNYIMMVGKTHDAASEQSENLRRELLENPMVREVIGSIKGGREEGFEEQFGRAAWVASMPSRKVLVRPRGAGQAVRGALFNSSRPRLITVDDFEDTETVLNDELREKKRKWFFSDLLYCVDQRRSNRIIVIDTVKHEDALVCHLMERSDWEHIRWPVANMKTRESYIPDLWPIERVEKELATARRENNLDEVSQELFNEPISSEHALFQREFFRYYDENAPEFLVREREMLHFVIYDPAKTTDVTSAETGIVGVSVDLRAQRIYYREALGLKLDPDSQFNMVLGMAGRLGAHRIGIETVSLNEFILQPFRDRMETQGVTVPIVELKARGKKEDRIAGLAPYYRGGHIYHNIVGCEKLEQQLLGYPRSRLKDVMDAAAYVIQMLEEGGLVFSPRREQAPTQEEAVYQRALDAYADLDDDDLDDLELLDDSEDIDMDDMRMI